VTSRAFSVKKICELLAVSDSAMKANSSLSTKRKRAKAAQNRADTITLSASRSPVKRVLVIDIGGRSVKILATGQMQSRSFRSGPTLNTGTDGGGSKEVSCGLDI